MQIVMDDEDFNWLCNDKMPWAGEKGWQQESREGRFSASGAGPPAFHWKIGYWVGPDYVAVILAKSFLAAKGFPCEVIFDNTRGEWVILTDYDYTWPPSSASAQN